MTLFLLFVFDWFLSALHGTPRFFGAPWATAAMGAAAFVEFHCEGWVLFAAVMRLRDAYALMKAGGPQLSPQQLALGKLALVVGYVWDFGLMCFACVWLWDAPRETLLTPKLERIIYHSGLAPGHWKHDRAFAFRRRYLDNVDSRGEHRA